jgi:Methyltransferase domain
MPRSPREIAGRLGISQLAPAQALYRRLQPAGHLGLSPQYFARGYRFARQLSRLPAPPGANGQSEVTPLEAYAVSHTKGPGMYKWEHYFPIYHRHLSQFCGSDVHLVEVGVAGGGSLGMWRDYLGPSAHICGIDINPACKRFAGPGTEVVIGNQASPEFWRSFLKDHPRIDVLIDDGGHLPNQQVTTLVSLLEHIEPGGVYVCEDIHGQFHPFHSFIDGLTRELNTIQPAPAVARVNALQSRVHSVHRYPILTVIELVGTPQEAYECREYGSEWVSFSTGGKVPDGEASRD